jgi:hypothetical protein
MESLYTEDGPEVQFSDVLQRGPSPTRTKKEAEAALGILISHGRVEQVGSRPRTIRVLEAAGGQ